MLSGLSRLMLPADTLTQKLEGYTWEEKIQGHRQGQAQATYFTRGRAECPQDGAVLQIQEDRQAGLKTPGLLILSPYCGLQHHLPGLLLENG